MEPLVLLVGECGSGKSTLINSLCDKAKSTEARSSRQSKEETLQAVSQVNAANDVQADTALHSARPGDKVARNASADSCSGGSSSETHETVMDLAGLTRRGRKKGRSAALEEKRLWQPTMDRMYTSTSAMDQQMHESLLLIQNSEELSIIRKDINAFYLQLGNEAAQERNQLSQDNASLKGLQQALAVTLRRQFERAQGPDCKKLEAVDKFVEGILDRFTRKYQEVLALVLHACMEQHCHEAAAAYLGDVVQQVHELISKGADVNHAYHHPLQGSLTHLRHAVALNSPTLIKLLCKAGADLSRKRSPVHYAYELGRAADDAFEALAKYPQSFRAEDITPGIAARLVESRADINSADELGQTALHYHGTAGNVEGATALIENGAELDRKDSQGKTPFELAATTGAPEELLKLLDYAELKIGLGGQQIALPASLLEEPPDVVSWLKHHFRDKLRKQGKRVSYFSIRLTAGDGDQIARDNRSWKALGNPKAFSITFGCNFREDPKLKKDFLMVAGQEGADTDYIFRGHLEDYQDPDAVDDDERGEAAVFKAARNNDVNKLELLELACADFDKADRASQATATFIASQYGHFAAVKFLVDHGAGPDQPLNTGATPLYVAAQNGHEGIADLLLACRANSNAQTTDMATPLFIAAQMGRTGIVEKLIEARSEIELANATNATPLFIASQNNHEEIVKCLLRKRASLNTRTQGGASPAYIAAQKGSTQALELLLEADADANLAANDGATPILIAAQNAQHEAVTKLLEKRVDVTRAMKSGATALFVAGQNGHLQIVHVLVESNKSLVNMCLQNGTSPVYIAAQNGYVDVVRYLYEQGADIFKRAAGNALPFFIAAQNGHLPVLRFLLEVEERRPGDESRQLTAETDDGSAPLLVASQNGRLEILKALGEELSFLSEKRKLELLNHKKIGGASALYLAAQNGHDQALAFLLKMGASVHRSLDTLETPLFIACQGGFEAAVRLLLQANSNVNQGKHDGTTPLYIACQNRHMSVIQLLLDAEADPNVQNTNGATALFISSQKGFHPIVQTLLQSKADPTLSIGSGACPLYIAALKGHPEVCNELLAFEADVNQSPGHGTTPLVIALENGHEKVAHLLLESDKADVNKANNKGNTPLKAAKKADFQSVLEKLIARGAQYRAPDRL